MCLHTVVIYFWMKNISVQTNPCLTHTKELPALSQIQWPITQSSHLPREFIRGSKKCRKIVNQQVTRAPHWLPQCHARHLAGYTHEACDQTRAQPSWPIRYTNIPLPSSSICCIESESWLTQSHLADPNISPVRHSECTLTRTSFPSLISPFLTFEVNRKTFQQNIIQLLYRKKNKWILKRHNIYHE